MKTHNTHTHKKTFLIYHQTSIYSKLYLKTWQFLLLRWICLFLWLNIWCLQVFSSVTLKRRMENIAFKPTIGRFSPFLNTKWVGRNKTFCANISFYSILSELMPQRLKKKKKSRWAKSGDYKKKKMDSEWRENGTGLHVPFMHQGIGDRIALISAREASSCVRNKKRLPLPRL